MSMAYEAKKLMFCNNATESSYLFFPLHISFIKNVRGENHLEISNSDWELTYI